MLFRSISGYIRSKHPYIMALTLAARCITPRDSGHAVGVVEERLLCCTSQENYMSYIVATRFFETGNWKMECLSVYRPNTFSSGKGGREQSVSPFQDPDLRKNAFHIYPHIDTPAALRCYLR